MAVRELTTGTVLATSLLLLGVSAFETYREVAPYTVSGFSDEHRYLAIAAGRYDAASSLWSKDMVLRDCLEVADTLYARAQPTARHDRFLDSCDRQARAIAGRMPAYARAHLVQAAIAAERGQDGRFREALARATAAAPNVHWLAEQRSELAEANFGRLDAAGIAAYERDLRTLLDSRSGADVLAYRYVSRPQLRERLAAIVETAPQELQRRFLTLVAKRARGGTP